MLVISPIETVIAADKVSPNSSVQMDVNRAMKYADRVSLILNRSKNSYGSMIWQTLSRFESIGDHEPFMIALMAKTSGGRKRLTNDNFIGLYQILGYGPFQIWIDELSEIVDNRYYLMPPKRNIKEAILLLDKIFEKIWRSGGVTFYHSELVLIAKRFHCTPNRYSEIIYNCENGQSWAEDFYYSYLPLTNDIWYSR